MKRKTHAMPQGVVRRCASRGMVAISAAAVALALSVGPEPLGASASAATGCSGVHEDFNGDGHPDTVIADPEAAVGGVTKAGVVHVVYGATAGTLELTQEAAHAGPSEADDRFGHALAVFDADLDGCTDLAIGSPYEDVGTQGVDSGRAVVVYGSPAGLGAGKATVEYVQQTGPLAAMAAEAHDWLGYAVEAGRTRAGVPFLVVGVPGEDFGTAVDMGGFIYFSGATNVTTGVVNQDTTSGGGAVPDAVESYDRFGEVVEATPDYLVVSAPGEGVGTADQTGAVTVFNHALVSNVPKPLTVINQDSPGVNGACEMGDGFGTALAAAALSGLAGQEITTSLAIGSPGEDLAAIDGGAVQVFSIDGAGAYKETAWLDQDGANVEDRVEAGDHFGQSLAGFGSNYLNPTFLAIGVPGEDAGDIADRGSVHTFSMAAPNGAGDRILEPGAEIPAAAGPRLYTGLSLGSSGTGLLIGLPYGPSEGRAAHLFAWPTRWGWDSAPTRTFKPGEGGLPAEHSTFGTVVR